MAHQVVKGKSFHWFNFTHLEESDFDFLEKEFKFHPLDFDDLREETEIPKLDVYKHYILAIFTIPTFDNHTMRLGTQNLSVFVGKDYVVTVTQEPIPSVDRFFARAKKSNHMRKTALSRSTGFLLYKLLDYVFQDAKIILKELIREANNVELAVYDSRTKVNTKRLGIVRRNVLYLRHTIDPQRILLNQIVNTKKSYLSKDLKVYYDDVKDTLDSMWVISDNLKNIMDGLFDVNEAFLTHRTNEIIRFLTIISVILMPPTLITSYYGMNIQDLPFGDSALIVTGIIALSLLIFWLVLIHIDRRK